MGPPPVPKEMEQLKVFIGTWKCTGQAELGGQRNGAMSALVVSGAPARH